jgi:hypothetical protein
MKKFTYSSNPNTESCNALKTILDITEKSIKQGANIDMNQTIRQIASHEYMKQCLLKESNPTQPLTIDIQQWYDSK